MHALHDEYKFQALQDSCASVSDTGRGVPELEEEVRFKNKTVRFIKHVCFVVRGVSHV